jgi:hypothetical protein
MYRIKNYERGYVVEVQKTRFLFFKYWTHLIHSSGLPECPWHFHSFEAAKNDLIEYILKQTELNSK